MHSRYLETVLLGENRSLLSWLIRALMWPLSIVYRAGLAVYLRLYSSGIRKRYRLSVPVISVGNLTFGGTGKTPAVQSICRMLADRSLKVAVLSRGHGGSAKGAMIVSDGERVTATSAEVGDEPALLARSLPGVPVIVGKDRRMSGRLACERFGPDAIVLDDGLQYWQLHRDLNVVALDAAQPFGSGFVMPMGDLREPPSGLRRADVVLLVGAKALSTEKRRALVHRLSRLAPDALIFPAAREPVAVRCAQTGEECDLSWLARRRILAFCGIGRPASFFEMLNALDASVVEARAFSDHYRLSKEDTAAIIDAARSCGAEAVVTTEKDLARLGDGRIPGLYVLAIKLGIEDSSRFAEYITNRIDCQNTPAAS